jgi:hypothetical protein
VSTPGRVRNDPPWFLLREIDGSTVLVQSRQNSYKSGMTVTSMKNRFLLSAFSLALLCAYGCATAQTPADATPTAPAAPRFSTSPPEVRVTTQFTGVSLQIYHPETRTLYLWTGSPRPQKKEQMHCFKIQLSDTPSGTPQRMECE